MYGGLPLGADLFRFISEPHLGGINGFKNRFNDLTISQFQITKTIFISPSILLVLFISLAVP
jgi:hypothetical protein